MRDAGNSNLGIVRQPSLHGATLALLTVDYFVYVYHLQCTQPLHMPYQKRL